MGILADNEFFLLHPATQVTVVLCAFGITAFFLYGTYQLLKDLNR